MFLCKMTLIIAIFYFFVQPNCVSKTFKIDGIERILILALRKIVSGEELTYDYKFDKEDSKIPCACASRKCKKYLN